MAPKPQNPMKTLAQLKRELALLTPLQRYKLSLWLNKAVDDYEDAKDLALCKKIEAETKPEDYIPWEETERRLDALYRAKLARRRKISGRPHPAQPTVALAGSH